MSDGREQEDYEVGFRKPPKSGQFKKGVSGNPSGRPKKARTFGSVVLRELGLLLKINEGGKSKIITKEEGIAKQAVNKALGGHVRSILIVDQWRRQALESVAEEQRIFEFNQNRKARDLTDEQLVAILQSDED
jgi:hypothetical protein